ncbi:hypothetical protein RhiirC2_799138, partial [Rhizophagus irregularis]
DLKFNFTINFTTDFWTPILESKEHYRSWRAKLLRRWKELGLEDYDIPENLHECQTLCHDLEQHDPDTGRRGAIVQNSKNANSPFSWKIMGNCEKCCIMLSNFLE